MRAGVCKVSGIVLYFSRSSYLECHRDFGAFQQGQGLKGCLIGVKLPTEFPDPPIRD